MNKLFLTGLLLFNIASVFSSDQSSTTVPLTQPIKKEEPSKEHNDSSLENRKNLKYQATLSILGAEYSGFQSNFTIATGYFIDDKNLINLRYTFQNGAGSKGNTSSVDYPESLRAVAIGNRHFLGNSFNIMGSLYWKEHSKFDRANGNTYFYKDYGLGIRVGNEWQWQNFTMGCDWFGLNRTLVIVNNTFPATSFGLDQERTIVLLNYYLGYSF